MQVETMQSGEKRETQTRFPIRRTTSPKTRPNSAALGFGRHFSDHMFKAEYLDGRWQSMAIEPYAPLTMDPAASTLHYAQSIFEGFKAFRTKDGDVRLFRPEAHAARFARSAARVCIPAVPPELFVNACRQLVSLDREWVPGDDGCALYLRPVIFATEPFLGVRPASRYLFLVMTCPVGAYYASGFDPVRILVEREQVRACQGGLGDVKTAANYAASLQAGQRARDAGYAQVLWTDAVEHRYIEEVGTMNVFFVLGDEIVTPSLEGTILPGITRASVIELLGRRGMKVVERRLSLDEVKAAHKGGTLKEAFGTGTAAVISPIKELGLDGDDLVIGNGGVGPIAKSLFDEITGIQSGERPDPMNWIFPVD